VSAFKADGNDVQTAPTAFVDPLKALVDGLLQAYHAARQLDEEALGALLERALERGGRLLAKQLVGDKPKVSN
jgi:hypothetical protein